MGERVGQPRSEDDLRAVATSKAIQKILGRTQDVKPVQRPADADGTTPTESSKLELQAQRLLTSERKALKRKAHQTDVDVTYERQLRRIATKGVAELFNALLEAQQLDDATKSGRKKVRRMPKPEFMKRLLEKAKARDDRVKSEKGPPAEGLPNTEGANGTESRSQS